MSAYKVKAVLRRTMWLML